jgi:MerR family transcriptional regulator, repressor of the yfmOP operon
MTTGPSEPINEFPQQILTEIRQLRQNVEQLSSDVERLSSEIERSNETLSAETQKWDERFFQLSRDTLNFSRNVIITAAVVAVLAPILRESIVALIEAFQR